MEAASSSTSPEVVCPLAAPVEFRIRYYQSNIREGLMSGWGFECDDPRWHLLSDARRATGARFRSKEECECYLREWVAGARKEEIDASNPTTLVL